MLARKQPISLATIEEQLVLPVRPDKIQLAEEKLRAAIAARQAGQIRHIEAARQFHAQLLGQPQVLTRADVDEAGVALGPLFTAEAEALAARDAAIDDYQRDVTEALAGPLQAYRDALSEHLNQLDQLLSQGVQLHQAAVSAKVKLPSTVAAFSRNIQERAVAQARYMLAQAR